VTLDSGVTAQFLPMNTPRFYDETLDLDSGENPSNAIANLLPPVESRDAYRISFTGYSVPLDLTAIAAAYPNIPYLDLRDRTLPEIDLWSKIDEDTLEGMFFKTLYSGLDTESDKLQRQLKLAAKISRQILDGQEVVLP
jgi:hypothetical protein